METLLKVYRIIMFSRVLCILEYIIIICHHSNVNFQRQLYTNSVFIYCMLRDSYFVNNHSTAKSRDVIITAL